jgi:hypothetical protein
VKAANRCWELSLAFSWYARGRGWRAQLLRLEDPTFKVDVAIDYRPQPLPAHFVVYLPEAEHVVDWTARQFRMASAHPLIQEFAEVEEEWDDIGTH